MRSTFKHVLCVSTIVVLSATVRMAFSANDETTPVDHAITRPRPTGTFAKVPLKAAGQKNPLERDPNAVAAGKKLFGQHCAQCHGTMAEGRRNAPNLRISEVQNAAPGALFWVLSNGIVRRGMPDWSKLPEAQRWQITTYVKSLRPAKPAEQTKGQDPSSAELTKR